MAALLPSCPRVSSSPGLPSKLSHSTDGAKAKKWIFDRGELLEKPSKSISKVVILQDSAPESLTPDEEEYVDTRGMAYISPSCPRETRIPGLPSTHMPIAHGPRVVREPNMVDLLSACPRVSNIPGIQSCQQMEQMEESKECLWSASKMSLCQASRRKKDVVLDPPWKAYGDKAARRRMVVLAPSCPQESRIPGFPSAARPKVNPRAQMPSMIDILPTCPKSTQIPGLPTVMASNKTLALKWPSEDIVFYKPFKEKPKILHFHDLGKFYHDMEMIKSMVVLVPTCPKKARIPGFPSVPRDSEMLHIVNAPSMVNIVPTCPKSSKVAGLPSKVHTGQNDWLTAISLLWRKPLKKQGSEIHDFSAAPLLLEKNINMSNMRPSCPKTSKVPGCPSAPRPEICRTPSVVNIVPSCPKVSRNLGFPSIMAPKADQYMPHWYQLGKKPFWVKQIKNSSILFQSFYSREVGDIPRAMFKLTPTCPGKAKVPGFPSAPRPELKMAPCMTNSLPSCPKISRVPGIPSAKELEFDCKDWPTREMTLWMKPFKRKPYHAICSQPTQYRPKDDSEKEIIKTMQDLVPCCPRKATIPGFPSSPRPKVDNTPSIVNLLPSCPKVARIPGVPSIKMSKNELRSAVNWPLDVKPFCVKPKTKPFDSAILLPVHYRKIKEQIIIKGMLYLAPLCPGKARNPGFPSAPRRQVVIAPTMASMIPSCPKSSRVPGVPSTQQTQQTGFDMDMNWPTDEKPLFDKPSAKDKPCLQMLSCPSQYSSIKDKYVMRSMVSLVPCCPSKARSLGFPSLPRLESEHLPSKADMLPFYLPGTETVKCKDDASVVERIPCQKSFVKKPTSALPVNQSPKVSEVMESLKTQPPSEDVSIQTEICSSEADYQPLPAHTTNDSNGAKPVIISVPILMKENTGFGSRCKRGDKGTFERG